MDKITKVHLERAAYVYIRQSTLKQVLHNKESQHIQYGLVNRARTLGWQEVEVIDDDMGVSGSGRVKRTGFEKLLSALCQGGVGAIFAMDASRLARNGREWHKLLEFCGLVKTLIIDLDSIYDPILHNDRLLLGMKGTLSEMESSIFKQRSQAAMKQKAARGEFHTSVAIGYLANGKYLEKDPDKRIQQAIHLVFAKFRALRSVRQVLIWFREEKINLPTIKYYDGRRTIEWRLPVYNTILGILNKPIYAGSYVYGRTTSKITLENGHKKVVKGITVDQKDWQVLIKDHHEGYISWEEYGSNQKIITHNANMKGAMVRGSVKKGQALLGGLLRCKRCGRKMLVHYSGKVIRYQCKGALQNHGAPRCIGFGGLRVDEALSEAILKAISPLGIEAALQAAEVLEQKKDDLHQHHLLSLQQAQYEAERIERQYEAVEPENRLVTAELEKKWEQALNKVTQCEQRLSRVPVNQHLFTQKDKEKLLELGTQLRQFWYSEETSIEFKKHVARTLIKEIIVDITDDKVKLIIHWQGGVHTKLDAVKNKIGHHRYVTNESITGLIEKLARCIPDNDIASLLNRLGKKTGKGNTWNQSRVCTFRNCNNIIAYKKNEHHSRGELNVVEVSEALEIPSYTVRRLIKNKLLPAKQVCKSAPWVIKKEAVDEFIKKYGKNKRNTTEVVDPNQTELVLITEKT